MNIGNQILQTAFYKQLAFEIGNLFTLRALAYLDITTIVKDVSVNLPTFERRTSQFSSLNYNISNSLTFVHIDLNVVVRLCSPRRLYKAVCDFGP